MIDIADFFDAAPVAAMGSLTKVSSRKPDITVKIDHSPIFALPTKCGG